MGVDGVHTAILHDDGRVSDDSPVVYICPMDSPSVFVIADSFLGYLADGCGVQRADMAALLEAGGETLIDFVRSHFDRSRLLAEDRTEVLDRLYGDAIQHRDL